MRKTIAFASALFLLFALAGTVNALSVEAPTAAFVFDSPREFWIKVTNDSSVEKTLSVKYFSATTSELIEVPEKISADSSTEFRLKIYPRKDLQGQTYESTLVVELGNEKAVNTISLAFKKTEEEITQPEQEKPLVDLNAVSNSISTGFASLATIGSENALIIILVIIAAVLLLAFIARFIQRIR